MIDDEPEYLLSHAEALEDEGFDVIRKSRIDEAIHLLKNQSFDLIIMDMLMPSKQSDQKSTRLDPRLSGIRLHREIRIDLAVTDTPIIFMSVLRDENLRSKLIEAERHYYDKVIFLSKPVRPTELIRAVKRVIEAT